MAAAKTTAKKKDTKPANGFNKPMALSKELQRVVGDGPMSRGEVTKKLWEYIKRKELQDPKNKRTIRPNDKLGAVIGTKPIDMFKMTKALSEHLS